jgi:hypothetical protein
MCEGGGLGMRRSFNEVDARRLGMCDDRRGMRGRKENKVEKNIKSRLLTLWEYGSVIEGDSRGWFNLKLRLGKRQAG